MLWGKKKLHPECLPAPLCVLFSVEMFIQSKDSDVIHLLVSWKEWIGLQSSCPPSGLRHFRQEILRRPFVSLIVAKRI